MLDIRKILFPVEFHEASLQILRVACGIARRFNAEIIVLHVVGTGHDFSPNDDVTLDSGNLLDELVGYAERSLYEPVRQELEGLRVKCMIRKGHAAQEIVEAAREESASVIVMPTRGYKGFYSRLMGSVTAKVMYDADRPVLTAAHLDNLTSRDLTVKHVLCGVTFSEHSREVLRCAASVSAEFQAKLTIAHITPDVEMYGPGGNYIDQNWKKELVLSAQELIASLQRETGVKGEVAVDSGDPGAALSRIAQQVGADLLVAGCHGSGGHFGSHGYEIVSESQVPVLSL
jgi:nucleotide-binding universal stress UspA family protein